MTRKLSNGNQVVRKLEVGFRLSHELRPSLLRNYARGCSVRVRHGVAQPPEKPATTGLTANCSRGSATTSAQTPRPNLAPFAQRDLLLRFVEVGLFTVAAFSLRGQRCTTSCRACRLGQAVRSLCQSSLCRRQQSRLRRMQSFCHPQTVHKHIAHEINTS